VPEMQKESTVSDGDQERSLYWGSWLESPSGRVLMC
jgi:hypothetical protein